MLAFLTKAFLSTSSEEEFTVFCIQNLKTLSFRLHGTEFDLRIEEHFELDEYDIQSYDQTLNFTKLYKFSAKFLLQENNIQ